jgi:hypothetical protein
MEIKNFIRRIAVFVVAILAPERSLSLACLQLLRVITIVKAIRKARLEPVLFLLLVRW